MADDGKVCGRQRPAQLSRRRIGRLSLGAALAGLSVVGTAEEAEACWCRCSVAGCPCQFFAPTAGNANLCECGHTYADHW